MSAAVYVTFLRHYGNYQSNAHFLSYRCCASGFGPEKEYSRNSRGTIDRRESDYPETEAYSPDRRYRCWRAALSVAEAA
jgi:hypothetical protein